MLERLSNALGVSGHEGAVRSLIREAASPFGETFTDTMGNLYAHKAGKGPKIMVCAHMDEVGMLVKGVHESGVLAYDSAGIDARALVSKRVAVGPDRIPGVIGAKAIHLQTKEEFAKALKHKDLYIDIGAKNKEDALNYVKIGDAVGFTTRFSAFGDGLMKGKALDDRLGCAALLELLKRGYACDFYAVFTVQEEVGLRGARVAANRIAPDLALVLEATTANDMPDAEGHECVTHLGDGPAISFMDRGTVVKAPMLRALTAVAEKAGIPYQLRRGTRGGNDAAVIHRAGAGAVTGSVSVPCRYIHSPVSVASFSDFENTVVLVDAFLGMEKFREVLGR